MIGGEKCTVRKGQSKDSDLLGAKPGGHPRGGVRGLESIVTPDMAL